MDDRKRPALDELSAGRGKRQAIEANGTPVKAEEESRDEDLDRFTKDAILRQLKEYKREKNTLEQDLAKATKRASHHDEHLRIIDAWFLQLLDELALLYNAPPPNASARLDFSSSLLSAEPKKFEEHLGERSAEIKAAVTRLFSQSSSTTTDVKTLRERLTSLLAAEKCHAADLLKALTDQKVLDDRLFSATTRYMTAEKALDRARSAQVIKLETFSRAGPVQKSRADSSGLDGTPEAGLSTEALEFLRKEAQSVAGKQKDQVDKLAEENKKLTEALTAAQVKLSSISEDDYANTELFKHFKTQHTEVIKRVNDLEARNIELRNEAKSLQAERTEYRNKVDNEFRDQDVSMQSEIGQKDADLTRVRVERDALNGKLEVQASTADAHKDSLDRFRELAESRQSRITALEYEVERLRSQVSATSKTNESGDAALDAKIKVLELERSSFDQELRSMETAYKKASSLASNKVKEQYQQEERLRITMEEKAKAVQKYFEAIKEGHSRNAQQKSMEMQINKSSEIISTLKEAETTCRLLLVNAEKQVAEAKDALLNLTNQQRATQQTVADNKATCDRLTTFIEELKTLLASKDEALHVAKKSQRDTEIEAEQLKLEVTRLGKDVASWKTRSAGSTSEEVKILKKLVYCTVCDDRIKDTFISKCKHVMCKKCCDNQLKLRERRCPICGGAYGLSDMQQIVL